MAIRDLQISMTEVGRIRLGLAPRSTGNPERHPAKLETLRFTSPNEHLVQEIGRLYGGQAREWTPQNGGRRQWEVITDESRVPVYVPRQTIDPWYEQWGNGVCTRRCDGERDLIHDKPCDCDPQDRGCKPTVRINLILADLPGTGVWRLESHGFYAASELSGLAPMVANAVMPLPGYLVLDQRERKYFDREKGKPQVKKYPVPVVLFDVVSARQLMAGAESIHAALTGGQATQIEAPQTRQAIAARPTGPTEQDPWADVQPAGQQPPLLAPGPDPSVVARAMQAIAAATTRDQMMSVQRRLAKSGLSNHAELTAAWNRRAQELARQAQQHAQAGGPPPGQATAAPEPKQAPAPVADSEPEWDESEPDRQTVAMAIMGEASRLGWDSDTLEKRAEQALSVPLAQADGWGLQTFLEMIRDGRVQ